MSLKRIDGITFEAMLRNGFTNLCASEKTLNILNVFPVADGDTGTNLRLTMENGLRSARKTAELNIYLKSVSEGMLYGARGNSGVILSQLFSGLSQELSRCASAGIGELKNAFYRAYRVAYASTVRPVEGTILTVAREGFEHIRTQIRRDTTVPQFFSMYVAEMRKSLAYTPELLPELKEAGVVDSGAMGYIEIVDGMRKYLYGEILSDSELPKENPTSERVVDLSLFDENSEFHDGYCMEFVLQRMNGKQYDPAFRIADFIRELERFGGSIVAVENGKRVKVHIHTHTPAQIISLCQRYGEFLTFKLENMQVQHNEHTAETKNKTQHVPLGVIAAVNGEGMRELFTGVGCTELLEGGASMNTSAQEFVTALRRVDAEKIVVMPNDKNIEMAAKQAIALSRMDNAQILPTRSMVEGYFALAMDVPDSSDVEYRLRQMRLGMKNVVTLSVAVAKKNSAYHGISCHVGEPVAFLDGEPVSTGTDYADVIQRAIAQVADIENKDCCVLFRGRDVSEEDEAVLAEQISNAFSHLEVNTLYGGQAVYPWLIGII